MEKIVSKADRTRQFIIETTANIFNKKGYAGTSLSDLTLATGLTKGSIYGNFENKEDVALAVFDYNHSKILTQVRKKMDEVLT
jgi:TetR/AcrR family transcriptional repressor of nem operon